MNIASIDIGTNTVLLLVARIDLKGKAIYTLHEEIRMPRIGRDLYNTGKISEDKIEELIDILHEYKKVTIEYNCSYCLVIGTHALRSASNNKEVQKRIFDNTVWLIDIISPEYEAECAFYGVRASTKYDDPFAIVDIGGGSTEIIISKNNVVVAKKSMKMGVVTLKGNFITGYPISEEDNNKLAARVASEINSLELNIHAPGMLVGISGTPTTLTAIHNDLKIFDPNKINNTSLLRSEIVQILNFLKNSSLEEIQIRYGDIISKREDILYIGGIILLNIMDYFTLTQVNVSTNGIRHGVIYKKMFVDK